MQRLLELWGEATDGESPPSLQSLAWPLAVASTRTFAVPWSTVRFAHRKPNKQVKSFQSKADAEQPMDDAIERLNYADISCVMVPFIDLMSHAVPPAAKFDFIIGRGVVITALTESEGGSPDGIKEDTQVTLSYGVSDNHHLFQTYGFVASGNPIGMYLPVPLPSQVATDAQCTLGDAGSSCASSLDDGSTENNQRDVRKWLQGPRSGGELPKKHFFPDLLLLSRGEVNQTEGDNVKKLVWSSTDTAHLFMAAKEELASLQETIPLAPLHCAAYGSEVATLLQKTTIPFLDYLTGLYILADGKRPAEEQLFPDAEKVDDVGIRALLRGWLLLYSASLSREASSIASAYDGGSSMLLLDASSTRISLERQYRSWVSQLL